MSYETDTVRAPYAADEEVQRLRDLWRPSIQVEYQPLVTAFDPVTLTATGRSEDYDPAKHSLWLHNRMYVIPPDIAQPLLAELDEHVDGSFFDNFPGSWEDRVLHGAKRFLNRFVSKAALRPAKQDSVVTRADTNFTEPFATLGRRETQEYQPSISVDAPAMERNIPNHDQEMLRFVGPDDPDRYPIADHFMEPQPREGILGWTIPRYKKLEEGVTWAASLLRAKNHLVEVHWYDMPRERLSFRFEYPQLSRDGEEMLDDALVSLEPIIPEGTDYDELYVYTPIKREGDFWTERWDGTNEARERLKAERKALQSRYEANVGFSRW